MQQRRHIVRPNCRTLLLPQNKNKVSPWRAAGGARESRLSLRSSFTPEPSGLPRYRPTCRWETMQWTFSLAPLMASLSCLFTFGVQLRRAWPLNTSGLDFIQYLSLMRMKNREQWISMNDYIVASLQASSNLRTLLLVTTYDSKILHYFLWWKQRWTRPKLACFWFSETGVANWRWKKWK